MFVSKMTIVKKDNSISYRIVIHGKEEREVIHQTKMILIPFSIVEYDVELNMTKEEES